MPGPNPHALWLEEYEGQVLVTFERYCWTGNAGNRQKRAVSILKRKVRRDWYCRWCGDALPVWRRADAKYCSAGCKVRAAHKRRKLNEAEVAHKPKLFPVEI